MGLKKHKRHKSDKKDRHEGGEKQPTLKLILKVSGNNSTPEHSNDSPGPAPLSSVSSSLYSVSGTLDDESRQSAASFLTAPDGHYEKHKKAKKKKRKKDRSKDREKKHKHHHKEKKRRRDESSPDDISNGEESLGEIPMLKRMAGDIQATPVGVLTGRIGSGIALPRSVLMSENFDINVPSQNPDDTQLAGTSPREPRTCVLRQRQEQTPFIRLLESLLKSLEKRDPQQFFAWPVTDLIAPGYSQIIKEPMDFSTMKQKISEGLYNNLTEFYNDFKLMCNNAMEYNHVDTIYYKSAKKLLHAGTKLMTPEKIRSLRFLFPFMNELTTEELGFEMGGEQAPSETIEEDITEMDTTSVMTCDDSDSIRKEHKRKNRIPLRPLSKFEAIPDDLSPEEILAQAQEAAHNAKTKLMLLPLEQKMGFLRQRKDGTTTLNILIGSDGVKEGTKERPISLGALTGKLVNGSTQIQGYKEDKRNVGKPAKPLYYGAFGSYAPSYDSTFANLTKEESDLVFQTYGDETAVQYAESILDFAKDSEYTLKMVDNLLDILTGGEHSKTKVVLEERKRLREEEEEVRRFLEGDKTENDKSKEKQLPETIDVNSLKTLSELGIDTSFLDNIEEQLKVAEEQKHLQDRLETTSQLLEKLQQVQHSRLSAPPPAHLANIAPPSETEINLADKISENLTNMAKKVTPADVVTVPAVRKALGIDLSEGKTRDNTVNSETNEAGCAAGAADVPDLESELREFLESEPALSNSPLHDDKTIEEILME